MIQIAPINPDQVAAAKNVIYDVAHNIFAPEQALDEFRLSPDGKHWLDDVDQYQEIYSNSCGLFLVALDGEKVVGTGAIHRLKEDVAELKRIWLLEQYHGQKIGYRVVSMLLDFARQHGYRSVYLETSPQQKQAISFYKKMGFDEIASPYADTDEISMELTL